MKYNGHTKEYEEAGGDGCGSFSSVFTEKSVPTAQDNLFPKGMIETEGHPIVQEHDTVDLPGP